MVSKVWRFLIWLGIGRETRIDDTSELIRIGRDEYKYVEGERSLVLQIDMAVGKSGKRIYPTTIKRWLPPYQDEKITEADRHRIANKIANFFARQGISAVIDD